MGIPYLNYLLDPPVPWLPFRLTPGKAVLDRCYLKKQVKYLSQTITLAYGILISMFVCLLVCIRIARYRLPEGSDGHQKLQNNARVN